MTGHAGIARMEAATISLEWPKLHRERIPAPVLRSALVSLLVAVTAFLGLGALMASDQANQPETIHRAHGKVSVLHFERP